jgi:hypothetical protein
MVSITLMSKELGQIKGMASELLNKTEGREERNERSRIMRKTLLVYRGYTIKRSGHDWYKVFYPSGMSFGQRVESLEAGRAMIDATAENRVMTPAEHALVHPASNLLNKTEGEERNE